MTDASIAYDPNNSAAPLIRYLIALAFTQLSNQVFRKIGPIIHHCYQNAFYGKRRIHLLSDLTEGFVEHLDSSHKELLLPLTYNGQKNGKFRWRVQGKK